MPLCLAYLYARQHLALLPGKATAPIAVEDGDQWDIQLSDLQRQKSFERQVPLTPFMDRNDDDDGDDDDADDDDDKGCECSNGLSPHTMAP